MKSLNHEDPPSLQELVEGFQKMARLQRALLSILEERGVVAKSQVIDRACEIAFRESLPPQFLNGCG